MQTETRPGFSLKYKNHEIKFIHAFQLGFFSEMLEYETDWNELMQIVGNTFDQNNDLDKIKGVLQEVIGTWLSSWEDNQELEFDIQVKIEELKYFNQNSAGRTKLVTLNFNDQLKTQIVFFVTRMRKCHSLRELASETIAESLKSDKDCEIDDFEIPKTLKEDLDVAIKSQWTARWHKK